MFSEKEIVYLQHSLGGRFASIEEAKKQVNAGQLIIATTVAEMDEEMFILDGIYAELENKTFNFTIEGLSYLELFTEKSYKNNVDVLRQIKNGTIILDNVTVENQSDKVIMIYHLHEKVVKVMNEKE